MELKREHWTKADYQGFCTELLKFSDEEFARFCQKGILTERPVLGVRTPKMRAMAKEILSGNWREFLEFSPVSLEETEVRGFVIAGLPYEGMMVRMDDFIALMDNWAVCDAFCSSIKSVKKHREEFLEKIGDLLSSFDEYQTRVALVCLLSYYVDGDYLPVVFDRLREISGLLSDGPGLVGTKLDGGILLAWDAYYVKMAVAWLISVCFAKFPEETLVVFERLGLPKWTHNKAISKTCESLRVDRGLKETLKKMRK